MDRRVELEGRWRVPTISAGSALYADMSGFTRLTEELGRTAGPRRGAEEISALLTRVFEPVTAAIARRGGSVISFGGDSVICWFEGDDGWRATSVGAELVELVRQLRQTERGAARELDIRVAVASGKATRTRVGGPAHSYIDVLDGEVMKPLLQSFASLAPGEVGVSPEVAAASGSRFGIREISENGRVKRVAEQILDQAPMVDTGEPAGLETDAVSEWVPPYVRERLERGLGQLMGQLRNVVTMFVAVGGPDLEEPAGTESFDAFVCRAQDVVARYEGMVLGAASDEKGRHLYAVFGASIAHEDEARRAVVAGLELARDGAERSAVRAGIASGTVFVGAYGGSQRMTFGAIGPAVNLAARLMGQASAGEVLTTGEIARRRGHHAAFSEGGAMLLKGIDLPVEVFRAEPGPQMATTARLTAAPSRLIGRDSERERMISGLVRLQSGEGSAFIVEGPAGIGKSRLLTDFVSQARLMGTTVITTAGEEIEQGTAFFAWRSILRQLFGTDDEGSEIRLLEFVANDPWRADRVGLLDPVIANPVEDTYLTAGMEPSLRMENTLQLLVAIVRDAPRSAPLVLVLDDGHWMDSSSWAMARRIVEDVPSLMVVIATRPFSGSTTNTAPDGYAGLIESEATAHISLKELEPDEALELVEWCLGVSSLPGPVSELIVEQAGGHPYFSEEIGFALRDAGLLILENGESRLAPEVHDLGEIDFPKSVQDMITGRFDRLGVLEQLVLKVASVVGREFSAETVAAVYPDSLTTKQVEEVLAGLVPLDLTQPVEGEPGRYRFRHAITRDIAYGLLLYAQRHELHRAVAGWIESSLGDDVDDALAPLAYHLRNSLSPDSPEDDVDRALDYLGRAGRKSLRSFAHREAIGFLGDALSIASGKAQGDLAGVGAGRAIPNRVLARWEQDLAEAQLGMGRVDQSAMHFESALELHGHPMGRGKVGVGTRLFGAVALQAGHRISGGRGAAIAEEERSDLVEAATAYERLMKIYYYANDPGALVTAALSGLNLAERAGTSPVLSRIYANMSIVAGIIPMHSLARTYRRRSREVAEEVDQMTEHAWVRLATSVYGVGVGEWDLVEQELSESYDLYKRLSDWRQLAENLGTKGQMLTARGRFEEVYSLGEELRELGAWRDDAQAEMWGWLYQGTSLLRRGNLQDAIARFRNGERLLHAGVGGANVGWLYGLMAETYWRLNDPDRARAAAASSAESLYSERPGVVFALDGFTGAAEASFGLWVGGRSRTATASKAGAEKAVKKLVGYSKVFPIGRPAARRYQGRLKEHVGDHRGALAEWAKALTAARELAMPFEEALTLMNIGRLSSSREHLEQALEKFSALGANHFVDVTRRTLLAI